MVGGMMVVRRSPQAKLRYCKKHILRHTGYYNVMDLELRMCPKCIKDMEARRVS